MTFHSCRAARRRLPRFAVFTVLFAILAVGDAWAGESAEQPRVRRSPITGQASFVTSPESSRITQPEEFLRRHGGLFGVDDAARQLRRQRVQDDSLGYRHTTYEQVHRGIPVFSGVLKIHQDAAGRVRCANGDVYPISPKLSVVPSLDAARTKAVAAAALGGGAEVESCELVIVDPGWYGDTPRGACLAYHVTAGQSDTGWHEAFFIDAHTGEVLDRWPMVCTALARAVHDGGGAADLPGPLARGEGDPPAADADVNAAYDYAGDTYAYYWHAFGRDSLDDAGLPLVITVNTGAVNCPNAFWSGSLRQVGMCTGLVGDDVVAHELTHGLTQHTANLVYQNQSGQLNESFSDVFGELVDLFNGGAAFPGTPEPPPAWSSHATGPGTDVDNQPRTACSASPSYPDGVRWLFAEDAPAWNGAIRDLWDPVCMGDPDRANSPLQTCSLIDNGGVHSGNGVPNHAFAMLCDGKVFNGYTINPIGPIKAGAVWYRALTVYLTPASDFQDAYAAFNQAAADLVGTDPNDPRTGLPSGDPFTAADAVEVDKALLAVEMDTPGACGATATILDPAPPVECEDRAVLFADDMEAGTNGWMVFNSGPPTPYDWARTSDSLPAGRPGAAWFCPDLLIGDCSTDGVPEMGTHSLVSPPIQMPADVHLPTLRFRHYIETEARYDGGQVMIRVNGGTWQTMPAPAFRYNGYNITLFTSSQGNTNPNAGQLAFSGADGNWGVSLVDLGPYVGGGDIVEVRFEFSKDWCYGLTGWYVDDVEVYHCPDATDCDGNSVADDVDLAGGVHRDAPVSQPPNHSSSFPSDLDPWSGVTAIADNFILLRPQSIESIRLWGGYYPNNQPIPVDRFTVRFHEDAAGLPGAVLAERAQVVADRAKTGVTFTARNIDEWEYTLVFDTGVPLPAGTFFVEILNDTTGGPDTFAWERALHGHTLGIGGAFQAPGVSWLADPLVNMSMELFGPVTGQDCNSNQVLDACDAWGDATGDGQVDGADVGFLAACLSGPDQPASDGCLCLLDADGDADLDLRDYAVLQTQPVPIRPRLR
ncbi:MAG: M4 family metallopeptidase [Phycisphaerae bacterium]|nr:M4 family metallopeptidase [Phycisphaerae bacterium]